MGQLTDEKYLRLQLLDNLVLENCIVVMKQKLSDDLSQELVSRQFTAVMRRNASKVSASFKIEIRPTSYFMIVTCRRWTSEWIVDIADKSKQHGTLIHIFQRFKLLHNIIIRLGLQWNDEHDPGVLLHILLNENRYLTAKLRRLEIEFNHERDDETAWKLIKNFSATLKGLRLRSYGLANFSSQLYLSISTCSNLHSLEFSFRNFPHDTATYTPLRSCIKKLPYLKHFHLYSSVEFAFPFNWLSSTFNDNVNLRRIIIRFAFGFKPVVLCDSSMQLILSRLRCVEVGGDGFYSILHDTQQKISIRQILSSLNASGYLQVTFWMYDPDAAAQNCTDDRVKVLKTWLELSDEAAKPIHLNHSRMTKITVDAIDCLIKELKELQVEQLNEQTVLRFQNATVVLGVESFFNRRLPYLSKPYLPLALCLQDSESL